MTVSTFTGLSADEVVMSEHADYATARAGGALSLTGSFLQAGQVVPSAFRCFESFVAFDTSAIPDTDVVTAVTFSLWGFQDASDTDFTIEARLKDWGATVDTGDWVAGADLGSLTLLASYNTSAGWSTSGYNDFTSEAAFATNINKTGTTRLLLCSSRHRVGNQPGGQEYVTAHPAVSGTEDDPKLVVTHEEAGGGGGGSSLLIGRL